MRRKLRLFGFAIIITTIMMLAADVAQHVKSSDGAQAQSRPSPAGFSHDLTGTGTVTTAFSGRVTMVAEESEQQNNGEATFTPRYFVEGDDPTPSNDGMALTSSVIASSESNSNGFRVDAPDCWLPIDKDSQSLRFDFNQLWKLNKPEFLINSFGNTNKLNIKSATAELDPKNNLIFADGFFTLDAGDLHLEGQSLTYNPESSKIEFTPYHGLLRWSIRSKNGKVIQGDCDGPGSFEVLKNGNYLLKLTSQTSVRTHFPEGSDIVGDIETPALNLQLTQNSDGGWRPLIANLGAPTLWHGDSIQLRGNQSTIAWNAEGVNTDLLIKGPINIIPNNNAFIKTTASDYAQVFADDERVHLVGDVTIHRPDGSIKGNRAFISRELLALEGAVSIISDRGVAMADNFATDNNNNWILQGNAFVEPNDSQISWIRANSIKFFENEFISAEGDFESQLIVGNNNAELSCDFFNSTPQQHFDSDIGVWRRNSAHGNVVLNSSEGFLAGNELTQTDIDTFKISAKENGIAHGEVIDGQQRVRFRCGEIRSASDELILSNSPQIAVPTDHLNLLRDIALLSGRKISYFRNTNTWEVSKDVEFQGSVTGHAQHLIMSPTLLSLRGGLQSDSQRCSLATIFSDKSEVEIAGDRVDYIFNQSLTIKNDVFVKRTINQVQDWVKCEDFFATATQGKAAGGLNAMINNGESEADFLTWHKLHSSNKFVFHGNAKIMHPQAVVQGDLIEFDPESGTFLTQMNGDGLASIKRADGQSANGSWIKYNYLTQSLDARSATFKD
ncbi:MAG: hypothetical protein QGF46_03035 [Planctomycetota bacterium]|nr:hypothetical protein [Planctomycetota bacterium]